MGISDVVAVEPGERRRTLAADLGATDVWEPERLERFPPWEPERLAEPSFHVVLECSGKKAAMEAGFYQLARGGTLALVGAGIEGPSFDPNRFVLNELSVCRLVHLRRRRIRARPRACWPGPTSRPTFSSSRRT